MHAIIIIILSIMASPCASGATAHHAHATHATLVSFEAMLMGVKFYSAKPPNFKEVKLVREPSHFKDRNAIIVQHDGKNIGHVNKAVAKALSYIMDFLTVKITW